MHINVKRGINHIALASSIVLLTACGGGGSTTVSPTDTAGTGSGNPATNPATIPASVSRIVENNFSFPIVTEAGGNIAVEIPTSPAPLFSARRTLKTGTGSAIEFGDPVVLNYNMFSWATGEIVETTDSFDEPVTIRAGLMNGVPEFLTKSLLGRRIGDQLQLVFESEMHDLPAHLDRSDAYVLVVDLL